MLRRGENQQLKSFPPALFSLSPSFSQPTAGRPSLCSCSRGNGGGLWFAACSLARPFKSRLYQRCYAAGRWGGPHRADLRAQVRLMPSLGAASSSFHTCDSPLSSPTLTGPWGPLQNVSIDFAGSWAANVRRQHCHMACPSFDPGRLHPARLLRAGSRRRQPSPLLLRQWDDVPLLHRDRLPAGLGRTVRSSRAGAGVAS